MRDETLVVGNDLTELFLPHHLNVSARLARHGRFPLWDDSGFGGRPMVGNSQGACSTLRSGSHGGRARTRAWDG
ncbi:MAG: hypothetical protein WKF75_18630 [Singulisphaera sp.]